MNTLFDEYDYCWTTDDYEDQCCELCPHKNYCSGYEDKDEE